MATNRKISRSQDSNQNVVKQPLMNSSNGGDSNQPMNGQLRTLKQHSQLLTRDQVPEVMREPYIIEGYRLVDQPWSYYWKTFFTIHNDSGNVWSHLVSCVAIWIFMYYHCAGLSSYPHEAVHSIWMFAVCCTITFALSSLAHLLHARSSFHHYLFFSIDYLGIALYGYGYGTMAYHCSGTKLYYQIFGNIFPYIHIILVCNVTFSMTLSRVLYPGVCCWQRKALQAFGVASDVIFCYIISVFRIYDSLFGAADDAIAPMSQHIPMVIFTLTNVYTFTSHQPEKTYPGQFDYWGLSHHWFHLSVLCCALFQLYAASIDLQMIPVQTLDMAQPDSTLMWASLAGCMLINMAIILIFVPKFRKLNQQ